MKAKAEVSYTAFEDAPACFEVACDGLHVLVLAGTERNRKLAFAIKKALQDFVEAEKGKVMG